MTSITPKTLLFLVAFCLFAIACNSSEKAANKELKGNPNILPVEANAKAKKEIDLKQTGQKTNNLKAATTSNEAFEWNKQTEKEFLNKCETSIAARKNINAEKYCPCILDLLKGGYSANQLNKAIQDNPQKATNCLKDAIIQ